jgi:hypothetical protein
MKRNKSILFSTASLLVAVAAQAQVSIYITGATGFRSQSYAIIRSIYDNGFAQNPQVNISGGVDKSANSNLVTWTGTISGLFPGQQVSIFANYNGAVAGIQNLTQGTTATFLSTNVGNYTTLVTNTASLAFSTVYQASTAYTTPTLTDLIFGATPIYFVKSINSPAAFTNITSQQLKELASNGSLPASYFTGNTNDATNTIYFLTRDTSAGQRVIVFADAGFTGTPLDYIPSGPASSPTWTLDNVGITSTTTIDNDLNKYGPAVSYLTGTDAITVTNGAIISYNGVLPYTNATLSATPGGNNYAPLINGQYSLWGYEHLVSVPGVTGNTYKFLTNFSAQLIGTISTNYPYSITTNLLNVSRNSDGGLVAP